MSDRDVRGLAKEVHQAYLDIMPPGVGDRALEDLEEWLDTHLLAFLSEREATLQAQLTRAQEEALVAEACSEGLSDQVADLQATVARTEGERDRALGEGAGLRQLIGTVLVLTRTVNGLGPAELVKLGEATRAALASTPLAERAGEVLEAAYALRDDYVPEEIAKEPMSTRMLCAAVEALRAELQKGGEGG